MSNELLHKAADYIDGISDIDPVVTLLGHFYVYFADKRHKLVLWRLRINSNAIFI